MNKRGILFSRPRGNRQKSAALSIGVALAFIMAAAPILWAQQKAGPPERKDVPILAQLAVRLMGIHNRRGQVVVSLFNKAEGFPQAKALATQKIDLSKTAALEPLVVTFKDLKPGSYAISAYHDENKNGRLDRNFLGIPQEDWGMSNNPRPWRMPRFDEAKFDLKAPAKTITVVLTH